MLLLRREWWWISKGMEYCMHLLPVLLWACGVFHTLEIFFRFTLQKVYLWGESSLLSLPVLIVLYHIFIHHILYLLTTDCYILSLKIMTDHNKKDFAGWIIFYVCKFHLSYSVHLSQLIFLMLPLNVLLLLNRIDCYSSNRYMG